MTLQTHGCELGQCRRLRAIVDLAAIAENTRSLQKAAAMDGHKPELMAIVKADGYGHGAIPVAKAALAAGATWLGVALPTEGVVLRKAGITAPILVLGAFAPACAHYYYEWQLTATLATLPGLAGLLTAAAAGRRIPVHLKVDTGMTRLGFLPDEAVRIAMQAKQGGVYLQGVYTHLATADAEDTTFALQQLTLFRQTLHALKGQGIDLPWRHAGNSAAIMQLALTMEEMNLVRAGIALYGLAPSPHLTRVLDLRPAMTLETEVVAVRHLPQGASVGYGATYKTSSDTTIVVLPVGYADGYTRRMSHRAAVLIQGRRYPVVGSICMDQCMVDMGRQEIAIGTPVVLMGKQGDEEITADDWAAWSGTINYEIVCGISRRVPRWYTSV
jgi:alanine racemase